jgi:hypothetical protein
MYSEPFHLSSSISLFSCCLKLHVCSRRSATHPVLSWSANSKVRSCNSCFVFPVNKLFVQRPHVVVGMVEFDTSSWFYVVATHCKCLFRLIMLMWHGVETAEAISGTRSLFVTLLSQRAQSGRWFSLRKSLWFTEWHTRPSSWGGPALQAYEFVKLYSLVNWKCW